MKIHTLVAIGLLGLALMPGVARADGQQDQNACMSDAFSVCGQFIPDRERVAACLLSNRNRISVACRAALTHFNARTASAR